MASMLSNSSSIDGIMSAVSNPWFKNLLEKPRSFDQDVPISTLGRPKVRNFYEEDLQWNVDGGGGDGDGDDPWLDRINTADETSTPQTVERDFVDQNYRRRMRRKHRNGKLRRRNNVVPNNVVPSNSNHHFNSRNNNNSINGGSYADDDDNIYQQPLHSSSKSEDNNIYFGNSAVDDDDDGDGSNDRNEIATKIFSRDAILVGERKPQFYGSSPGSGSYPKYYYENNPDNGGSPDQVHLSQRIDPATEDGIFTKIFNFFDRFFNYWADKTVDSEASLSGGSSALKRTDEEKEDAGSSSLGNYNFQILFSCVTDTLRCSEGEIH